MTKPAPGHLERLDLLRGAAILAVFLYHSLRPSYGFNRLGWNGALADFNVPTSFLALLPVTFGHLGVAVFFVVSGFCIHLSFARTKEHSWKVFFVRRFFRIYPPYLVCLAGFTLFLFVRHILPAGESMRQFTAHALLVHNFWEATLYEINPALWSIAVEVQLYLLYPVIWFLCRNRGWGTTLFVTALLETAFRTAATIFALRSSHEGPAWLAWNPLTFWFSWCLGAYLADQSLAGKLRPINVTALVSLGAVLVASSFVRPLEYLVFPLGALLTAGVINNWAAAPVASPVIPQPLWSRALARVGVVSYSLYLLHQPLVDRAPRVLDWLSPGPHSPLAYLGACGASFLPIYLAASWFYRLVELPSIAAGKRLLGKTKGKVTGPIYS